MRVFKKVLCYWLILPDTEVIISDALEAMMTVILKLGKIRPIDVDFTVKKLGLSAYSVNYLLERMEGLDLLQFHPEDGYYYLTEEGEESLTTEKIYLRKRVDLRLISINDPHFVLTHYWNRPPLSDFEGPPKITKDLLNQRRKYSHLNEHISVLYRNPEIISAKERILSFTFTHSIPEKITIEGDGRLQELEVKPNDPQILEIHSSLSQYLNLETRIQFLSNLIKNKLLGLNLETTIVHSNIDGFEIETFLKEEKNSINELKPLLRWLNDNGWKPNTPIRLKISVTNNWYIHLPIILKSQDLLIIHIMFCLYSINEGFSGDQLINSDDFLAALQSIWEDFCHSLQVSKSPDKNLLFDLWWELGAIGKYLGARLIEGEVLVND